MSNQKNSYMNNAMKQAFKDMKTEGIDTAYLYFSKAILEYTKSPNRKTKVDFRKFNKKSVKEIAQDE